MIYFAFWFLIDNIHISKALEGTMLYGPFSNHPKYQFLEGWFVLFYIIYYHHQKVIDKI